MYLPLKQDPEANIWAQERCEWGVEKLWNCVGSAQDRDYWRALVNAALNLQFS